MLYFLLIKAEEDHEEDESQEESIEDLILDPEASQIEIVRRKDKTLKERKAMLRKVLFKFHKFRMQQRDKKRKRKKKEIENEIRMRVYKIIKNLIYEKFSKRHCEKETMVNLFKIINTCNDFLDQELFMFKVYTRSFTATFTDKLLMRLRNLPLIGSYFFRILTNRTFLRYDMLLMMNITLNELLGSESFFKFEFDRWEMIAREIQAESVNFMSAQSRLLGGNMEMVKVIQTKKVAQTVLNFGRELLYKLYGSGEIEETEKKKLKKEMKKIQNRIHNVMAYIKKAPEFKTKFEPNNKSYANLKEMGRKMTKMEKRQTDEILSLRKKWCYIFPILNELDRLDLNRFRKELIHAELTKGDPPILFKSRARRAGGDLSELVGLSGIMEEGENGNPGSQSFEMDNHIYYPDDHYFYLIKSGMLQLKSMTGRVIKTLTSSDYFGSCALIARDVSITAECISKCKFYKIPLKFVRRLADKYPTFKRSIYTEAVYTYLKSCSYELARGKSKYFRQLRRIAFNPLIRILNEGKIMSFMEKEELLHFLRRVKGIKLTVFVLEGIMSVRQENVRERKRMNLRLISSRHSEMMTIRKSGGRKDSEEKRFSMDLGREGMIDVQDLKEKRDIKIPGVMNPFRRDKDMGIIELGHKAERVRGLDMDLLSRRGSGRKSQGPDGRQVVESGNVFVIHLNHLEDIDILTRRLKILVLKSGELELGKINRKRKGNYDKRIKRNNCMF